MNCKLVQVRTYWLLAENNDGQNAQIESSVARYNKHFSFLEKNKEKPNTLHSRKKKTPPQRANKQQEFS